MTKQLLDLLLRCLASMSNGFLGWVKMAFGCYLEESKVFNSLSEISPVKKIDKWIHRRLQDKEKHGDFLQ